VRRLRLITLLAALTTSWAHVGVAQTQPVPAPAVPESPEPPQPDRETQADWERWGNSILRIGQDYTLKAGDAAREVVVVFGNATIDGRVASNVVVVFGSARLSNMSFIGDSLIVVGGSASAAAGAEVEDDLVVIGGGFEAEPGFSPDGQHVVIGPRALGGRLEAIVPWITQGLLWGRPIVPNLPWVWTIVALFFLVYLILGLIFDGPVRASVAVLTEKPLTAFVVGLLVLLLAGPLCLLLAVSIVGIAVVPFVVCALFVALIVGKIGTARWIGMSIVRQEVRENRLQSVRSFVIGFAVICVAYMVPLLGFAAWGTLGVFSLGGATLAFIAGYRRENPLPTPYAQSLARSTGPDETARESAVSPDPDVRIIPVSAPERATFAGSELASFPRAPFRDRLLAFVLDVILVLIAQELLDLTRRDSAIFLLLLAYHIGFWTWKGTTVGGIICQLRLVRVDGAPLRFVDALVRGLSSIFSLAVLGLGCLWILRDPERQAWHDKIAGTYVVKVPRNWPL
jgi:uncharacterized RDD family membrane protein YckC